MKQKIYPLLYTVAIFLSGLFYIFLCDLAYFDRIAKNGGIWLNSCSYLTGHSQQICMAHYDVLCIFGVLGLLIWYTRKGIKGSNPFVSARLKL